MFIIVFATVSLLVIIFLKTQIYQSINDRYEPTISVNEVDNLSNTEIVEKLLTLYLEHYKAKPVFDDQKIKAYKNIEARVAKGTESVAGRTAFIVSYEVQQHFWNEYWQLGGGRTLKEGGRAVILHYAILMKENDHFRLKMKGLEPPTPDEIQSAFALISSTKR
ncbi:hypothetical protein [Pelosinus fermentans]|uniref:hypothetical protein n=1 Tax=Pelosinus fermentans TaxID=365349 RepID=UPI00118586B5|nr:hypothetical protein [Pelosinus fermentans]